MKYILLALLTISTHAMAASFHCQPMEKGPAIALDVKINGNGPSIDPSQVQISANPAVPNLTYSVSGFDNKNFGSVVITGQGLLSGKPLGTFSLVISAEIDQPNAHLTTVASGFANFDFECREN